MAKPKSSLAAAFIAARVRDAFKGSPGGVFEEAQGITVRLRPCKRGPVPTGSVQIRVSCPGFYYGPWGGFEVSRYVRNATPQ